MRAARVWCGWAMLAVLTLSGVAQGDASARELRRKHAAAWLREHGGRTAAGAEALARARAQRDARRARAQAAASFVGNWTPLGPAPSTSDAGNGADYGNVTGRVTALAVDAGDPSGNTVYAGGAFGGLWRTVNAQAPAAQVAWTPLLDSAATLAVGAVALQPGNSKVILVGTGEANSGLDSYYGQGVLRSTDGGKTWTLISNADHGVHPWRGIGFSQIAFSTDNPNLVLAATADVPLAGSDGAALPGTSLGLFASSDAGATWSLVELFDAGEPVDEGAATAVVYSDAAHAFFAAARGHGFYTSSDGYNWSRLPSQPGVLNVAGLCPAQLHGAASTCPMERGALAAVPGKLELYAWYISLDATGAAVQQGFHVSRDGGNSWTELNDAGFADCGDLVGCGAEQADYNMTLTAVPDGDASDLYAGAVNLFRCTVFRGTAGCLEGQWLNLTHAYGCSPLGAPAKVHPAQHALAFQVVNSKALFFAGNDGGVYRALDAYLGLESDSCSAGANTFDNLNAGLGSLAEVNGLAQDPVNLTTLLAGTEDNGSAATTAATTSLGWNAVNAGPGGPVAINPANAGESYTSNPGVAIERCGSGAACREGDYQADEVVNSQTLGGDVGGYYAPFLLDPQAPGLMLVGTCRVWRGNSDGSGFAALSLNFDTGTDAGCVGTETQVIRALGAGGAASGNGSPVVYALTAGGFNGSETVGGKVWVATNASLGLTNFADATGAINPGNYPLSAIVLDPADATGGTAYVGVTGFGVAHVWKTTDFGADWSDFTGKGTGALADAPVNALLIDAKSGVLYAGTDVGVFQTALSAASWTESGPAGGATLPNVPVMQLALFDAGGQRRLRVGTYGRGVWELNLAPTPDFSVTVPGTTSQTVLVGQSVTYSGTLTSIYGYAASVALSCAGAGTAPPGTCTVSPTSAVPMASGKPVTVTASNSSAGDFSFNLQGKDGAGLVRTAGLALHVTDFALGAPSPATAGVQRPGTTAAVALAVTPLGQMTGTVTLSCSGLPSGAVCAFAPTTVSLTPGSAVTANLMITVANTTPLGNSTVTVTAALSGSSLKRTQTVTLSVSEGGDFALAQVTGFGTVPSGQTATATASVSAINSFSPATSLSCSGSGIACTVSPASVTTYPKNVTLTVATAGLAVGSYAVTLTGTSGAMTHSLALTLNVSAAGDFTVAQVTAFAPVAAGLAATASASVSALNGFAKSTNVSCSGTGVTCSVTPATVAAYPANVTLTVPTTGLAAGSYPVTLTATSGSLTHTLALTVNVTDFTVTPPTTANSAIFPGTSAVVTFQLAGQNQYAGSVNAKCDVSSFGAGTTCALTPANPVALTGGSAAVTATVGVAAGVAPGNYLVNLTATDTQSSGLSHTKGGLVTVTDFQFGPDSNSGSITVTAGQQAKYVLDVNPANGAFAATLNFSCSGLPAQATCIFSPSSLTLNGPPGSVTMTVTTKSNIAALPSRHEVYYAFLLLGPGAMGLVWAARRRRWRPWLFAMLVLATLALWGACGGGGGSSSPVPPPAANGTPPGTYTLTVKATATAPGNGPTLGHSTQVTLKVQ